MYETSLQGDTLLRVLVIGLTRELPLPPSDALDIADKLVARAANTHTSGTYQMTFLQDFNLLLFSLVPNFTMLPRCYACTCYTVLYMFAYDLWMLALEMVVCATL